MSKTLLSMVRSTNMSSMQACSQIDGCCFQVKLLKMLCLEMILDSLTPLKHVTIVTVVCWCLLAHSAYSLPVFASSFVLPSPSETLTSQDILTYINTVLNIAFVTDTQNISLQPVTT